jgi:hypothetical protein
LVIYYNCTKMHGHQNIKKKINTEAPSHNHYCRLKAVTITYSECVCVCVCEALHIQYAKSMCHIVSSTVSCLALPHFSRYLINGTIVGKKATEHNICVLIFFTNLCEKFIISKWLQGDVIINVHRSGPTIPVILTRLEWKLEFLDRLSKNTTILNFIRIRPLGTNLFHAAGRTDRHICWS